MALYLVVEEELMEMLATFPMSSILMLYRVCEFNALSTLSESMRVALV